ncbi:HAD family phosphatase [Chloroflexota bacterium]|nr:HAD family phosphatase [Chloroflexota bacterium]
MTQHNPAILWDMDGTIVDSKDCHFHAWIETLKKRGIDLTEEVFTSSFGRNNTISLPYYLGYQPEPEVFDEIVHEKESLFLEMVLEDSKLVPGVETWLAAAQENGIRQALASSSEPEIIDQLIDKFGLRHYFGAIVPGAALPSKPNPEIFLKAARKIDRQPEQCVVIEDSLAGVEGGKNAGMKCIAVTTTFSPDDLTLADRVVEDYYRPLLPMLQDIELL